jgi:hypothetical protein
VNGQARNVTIARRRAWLDPENHIVADIGHDARRLGKRHLPDL